MITMQEKQISELTKALTATSASGIALQPEDLEPMLVEELMRLQPLMALMPRKQATARVHEIARRTAHGQAAFEGEMVDNRAGAAASTYDRPTVTMKVLHYWGAVSGFQQSASRRFINSLQSELQGGLEAVSNQFEFGTIWANADADPYMYDGFDKYIRTNIINHGAVATLTLLDDLIDGSTGARGTDADPGIFVMTKGMRSKISGLQTLMRREAPAVEFEGGLRMATYRGRPLLESDYMKPSAQAPAGVSAVAVDMGGTLPAGLYRYQIAAVYETGEQRAAAEVSDTAVGADDSIHLAWTGDANALLYKIYRSDVGGAAGSAYLYTTIAAKTRDGEGLITGNVITWDDTVNLTRPTNAAAEVPLGTGHENIFYLNLNPDRGAAVVGLVDALGEQVENLLSYIELARTRSSLDFMLESFLALQVPWQQLHAKARRVKVA